MAMSTFKTLRISFCNHKMFMMIAFALLFWVSIAWTQNIQIIKATDLIAVIDQGSMNGIQKGDYFVVKRLVDNSWQEITYAEAISVKEDMSGIRVLDIAPQIMLVERDIVEKVTMQSESNTSLNSEPVQTSTHVNQNQSDSQGSVWQRDTKLFFLGPVTGLFVPLGDAKNLFNNTSCYGGMLGFRFRHNWDISLHFLYATKNQGWTFWNLQMLGRRYLSEHFLLDFGYGISYPEIYTNQSVGSVNNGSLHLGILLGAGYVFPIAFTTQFEIGFLFHIYPNFGDGSGEFLTVQGRLVL